MNTSNLNNRLFTIREGEKKLIDFNEIARFLFMENGPEHPFEYWKNSNRNKILSYFENMCRPFDIICQECRTGPMKGHVWVCKRVPIEKSVN